MQAEQPTDPEAIHLGEAEEVTHIVPTRSEWPPANEDGGVYDPDDVEDDVDGLI